MKYSYYKTFLSIKNKKLLIHTIKLVNLKNIMLSPRSGRGRCITQIRVQEAN